MNDNATAEELEPTPDGPVNSMAQIADLLNPQAEEPKADPPSTDDDPPEPDAEELTADDDPPESQEFDYDQEVSITVGNEAEKLTVGQLKDHYQESREFHQEREAWEDSRMQQDSEMLVARQSLLELADMLGDTKPEVVQYLAKQRDANNKQQAELLLQARPEWIDPAVKARARPAMLETWKEYGFSDIEFGSIQDHRVIVALNDLARLKGRLKKAQAVKTTKAPTGQKPAGRKTTKAQDQSAAIKRAKSGSHDDKMAAIGALIDG